jgi:hypothetical protein
VVPILYALRLGHRGSLLPAINLGQVSEFSIVIASLGLAHHQIQADVVTIVIMTFAVTSVGSTYMINSNHAIQAFLSRLMKIAGVRDLDASGTASGGSEDDREGGHVVFLGFFRDASSMLYEFESAADQEPRDFLERLLVIDFNPAVMKELRRRNVRCVYGDIAHIDTLRHAGIEGARLVVSSITDDILRGTSNLRLLRNIRAASPGALVVLTTEHIPQALRFYEAGADYVYIPRIHSSRDIAGLLRRGFAEGFEGPRDEEIRHLRERHEVLA